MSKVIQSPVKRFPGTVTIADPLTFPQYIAFQNAFREASKLENPTAAELRYAVLFGIIECVEEWDLENFPAKVSREGFPATPPVPTAELIEWLQTEIANLIAEDNEDPNE